MAFSKKNADARKEWLHNFIPGTFLDCSTPQFTIEDFVQRELILFSMADNVRSIPSVIDGLKPGLRKILFSCFKRKLKQEIKVAQLAGYVSEHAAYHHGEASLCTSIVGLAQDYTGSNNIPLLVPSGQFGTRLQGGKDAASPRYIFTCLSDVSRLVFMEADDDLLKYLNDDGQSIEPEWYMPIIPMLLVNGSEGIGTGWSTFIPSYSPLDIINNVLRKIDDQSLIEMHPWYRNFFGIIVCSESMNYKIYGKANLRHLSADWILSITELPIGVWTQNYKEFLETLIEKSPALVKGFTEHHTDTCVSFSIRLGEGAIESAEAILDPQLTPSTSIATEAFLKLFKLSSSISLTNMVAFDASGHLKRYGTALEILEDWYFVRLDGYNRRKEHLTHLLSNEWKRLDTKMQFISEVLEGKLIIARRSKMDLTEELAQRGYPEDMNGNGYDYLLGMPLWSLTAERILQLEGERNAKENELKTLLSKTACDLWKADLIALKKFLSTSEYYSNGAGVQVDLASIGLSVVPDSGARAQKSIKLKQENVIFDDQNDGRIYEPNVIKQKQHISGDIDVPTHIGQEYKPTVRGRKPNQGKKINTSETKEAKKHPILSEQSAIKAETMLNDVASPTMTTYQTTLPFVSNVSLLDRIQTILSTPSVNATQDASTFDPNGGVVSTLLPNTQPKKNATSNSRRIAKVPKPTTEHSPVARQSSRPKAIPKRGVILDDSSDGESILLSSNDSDG